MLRPLLLLLFLSTNQLLVKPTDDGKPFWKGCDEMKPMEKEDNAFITTCTDVKDHQWEVISRLISHSCEEILPAFKKDDYQHFTCVETSELLIRPKPKKDTTPSGSETSKQP